MNFTDNMDATTSANALFERALTAYNKTVIAMQSTNDHLQQTDHHIRKATNNMFGGLAAVYRSIKKKDNITE